MISKILRHPVRTLRAGRSGNRLWHRLPSKRVALGIGAAAVAVPLGFWLGRRLMGGGEIEETI